ncbi:ABC transporter permease [Lysobacter sp. CCNWLW3]|uniref:ABC transporter permease n=1 Tax=unclassified Lysobacter TaxID=2635362 RepID=UPI002FCF17CA
MSMLPIGPQERSLVWELTKRDVLGRYRGASFGLLWSLISPFLMLMVYTLAFGFILKSKWPGTGSTRDFALILFAGLSVHGFFAECLTRAPQLILSNANYVKRVVFPLQLLSWSMILSAAFHLLMNLAVLLLLKLFWHSEIHWTSIYLPLVMLPLLGLAVAVSWLVSALAVYFRDIGQFVGVLSAAMLFLSSAIIPLDSVPQAYRWVFMLNPLTLIIDQVREVTIWGRTPDWQALLFYATGVVVFALFSYQVFRKLRRGFADVL